MGGDKMAVQFLIGRSGSGKTHLFMDDIRKQSKEDPFGDPLIYIAPEQMTHQLEYEFVRDEDLAGMIRAHVFSFRTLTPRILQEVGGFSRQHITQTGMKMMLRKILEKRKEELRVFSKAAEKPGFLTHLEQMVTEFKRYCVSGEMLSDQIQQLADDGDKVLADKLQDLSVIYGDLDTQLADKYVGTEDQLRLLAEKIPESSYLREATVYIDGFHMFTPQEIEVVGQLMKTSKDVFISLTGDRVYDQPFINELDLFHVTAQTYHQLHQVAMEHGVEVKGAHVLEESRRYSEHEGLHYLERFFDDRAIGSFQGETEDIELLPAANRRAEVEGIARKIQTFVRENNYRYRDIAIMVRNTSDYQDLFDVVFKDYEIPYFIDQKKAMFHHPLVELIRSSLEVARGSWRYETIFRAVKTDLLFPVKVNYQKLREEMDVFENYVLAYGINGKRWTSSERWTYRRYRSLEDMDVPQTEQELRFEDKINELRELIVTPIHTLQKRFKKAKTGRELTEALFNYLTELKIPKKMQRLQEAAAENGDLRLAKEHDQAWESVLELMDQFVEMMGDEKISLTLFADIMEAGLESMEFALVPPAMDQVLIANVERSRLPDIKMTFIVGFNEGVFPAKPQGDGVLSDQEREQLLDSGVQLAAGTRKRLFEEQFLIYLATSSPSERLCISYPLANEEGKTMLASMYVNRIKEMFPVVKETFLVQDPGNVPDDEQIHFVSNPRTTLSYLAGQMQAWKRQYPMSDIWWSAYNHLMEKDQMWKLYSHRVLSALFYKNEAKRLTKETSYHLYGKHIQASVSRMEKYQACPFSHFASHGLRLKERKAFKLAAPDIGELFHAALKMISEQLRSDQKDWRQLTKKDCQTLSLNAVNELAPRLQNEILLSSNRHHYLKHKLQQIIERASMILSEHAKASGFEPIGLEMAFGPDGDLPSIQFELPNGQTMELIGRIDRVDKAESSKGLLLRIIDYKSSDKVLNLVEVYYGLALQMLAYLDVVVTYAEKLVENGHGALPAGVLYFHVHNPMINSSKSMTIDQIEEELFKKFKMKGLLLGDEESVRLMDQSLESGHSKIVSAGIKGSGEFYSNSSVASQEEFSYLRGYMRNKFQEIGTNITDGVVDIAPYKLKDRTPCEFCSYRSVCQFDQAMEENEHRVLPVEKSATILDKIREEGYKID